MSKSDGVQKRFAAWRRKSPKRSRIPKTLGQAAVREARKQGVWRTARRLRLDYYSLKRRLEEKPPSRKPPESMKFVELPRNVLGGGTGGVVEFRNPQGTQLRVEFRNAADASALAKALWDDRG